MTDTTMRERGVEPLSPKAPDPKSEPVAQLALGTDRHPRPSGTSQSDGAPGGLESTTESTTRLEHFRDRRLALLALWQPWATLCVAPDPTNNSAPPKRHETRHWRLRENELPLCVAIHAAKRYDGEVRYSLRLPRFRAAVERIGYYDPNEANGYRIGRPLIFGGIIGLGVVTAIYGTRTLAQTDTLTEDDKTFGNWEPGRWAWRLEHTILLPEPIEHVGRQQVLYDVDFETRSRIFAQLER